MMKAGKSTFKKLTVAALSATLALGLAACGSGEPERIVSHHDYKSYNDVEEVVRDADIIVVGRVKTVRPPQEWNINLDKSAEPVNDVYTLSDIEVLESVKGPAPGTTITIKQAGGRYEGKIYEESGAHLWKLAKNICSFWTASTIGRREHGNVCAKQVMSHSRRKPCPERIEPIHR